MPSVDDVTKCAAPVVANCLAGLVSVITDIFNRSIRPALRQVRIPATHEQIVDAELKIVNQFGGWPPTLAIEVVLTTEGRGVLRGEFVIVADLAKSNLILHHAGTYYAFKTARDGAALISTLIFKDLKENKFAA